MRFDKLDIQAFGELRQKPLDFSRGNIHLVFGANERGKSTLLSFMRSVCFGYEKRLGESELFAVSASQAKGTIDFHLRDGRVGSVFRSWKISDSLPVEFCPRLSMNELTSDEYANEVLGGANRDFFSSFFGLSYVDLATGERQIASSNLTRLIYGLSFGDGERVERVKARLGARIDKLFNSSGNAKNYCVNAAIERYCAAKSRLSEGDTKQYLDTRRELEEQRRLSDELLKEKEGVDRQKSELETLEKAWDYYVASEAAAWGLREFLARIRYDSGKLLFFAETIETKYSDVKNRRDAKRAESEKCKRALEDLRRERESCERNLKPKYVELGAKITELASQASQFKEGRVGLIRKQEELELQRSALRDELVEIGVVEADAPEERFVASYKTATRPLADALVEEVASRAEEEKKLQEKLRESKAFTTKTEAESQKIREKLDALLPTFDEEFSGVEHDLERSRSKTSEESVKHLTSDYSNLEEALQSRSKKIAESEEIAKELAKLACKEDESDFRELWARLENNVNLTEPIGLEGLREKSDGMERQIVDQTKELTAVNSAINEIKNQIKKHVGDADVFSADETEFNATNAKRKEIWSWIRNALLTGETPTTDSIQTPRDAVVIYETTVQRLEELHERRRLHSSLQGELGLLRGQLEDQQNNAAQIADGIASLEESLDAIKSEANAILQRYGFDFCSSWSLGVCLDWIDRWNDYRDRRLEIDANEQAVLKKAGATVDEFRSLLELANEWGIVDGENVRIPSTPLELVDLRVVEPLFAQVKELTLQTRSRVARYGDLFDEIKSLRAQLADKSADIQRYNDEAKELAKELDALNAARARFCESESIVFTQSVRSSWQKISDALAKLKKWREKARQMESGRREYERFAEDYERCDALASEIAEALGVERSSDARFNEDATRWNEDRESAGLALNAFEKADKDFNNKLGESTAIDNELKELDAELAALEEQTGVERDDFEAFRAAAIEYGKLKATLDDSEQNLAMFLHTSVNSPDYQDKVARLKNMGNRDEISRQLTEISQKAKTPAEKFADSQKCIGRLEKKLEDLGVGDERLKYAEEAQRSLADLRGYIEEYAPIQLAYSALDNALRAFEQERIPNIISVAGDYFRRLTGGRYLSIERMELEQKGKGGQKPKQKDKKGAKGAEAILFSEGESVGYRTQRATDKEYRYPNQLSQGTREQLYLALRLALVDEYCGALGREPLPILADDVLVQFDDERARKALELFKEIADRDSSRQFILMTHHESTRKYFSEIVGEEAIVDL